MIAGKAKGRKLKMVPGDSTRPISDRVKESLFNILGRNIVSTSFWDVFAGTGSVGIEALSRGAGSAFFTDNDRMAVATIRENLEITGFGAVSVIERTDVFKLLARPANRQFDFVYIAPPQYKGLWSRALRLLEQNTTWLYPDAWVIVQIDPREAEGLELSAFEKFDERKYGSTMLQFYEWTNE